MKLEKFDPHKLASQLEFDADNLNDQMSRHAGYFAYYAIQATYADREVDRAKMRVDFTRAKVDEKIREEAAREGVKTTEARIKAEIDASALMMRAMQDLNDARLQYSLLKAAVDSFRQRKDLIIEYARNQREEHRGNPQVVEDAQKARIQEKLEQQQKVKASAA